MGPQAGGIHNHHSDASLEAESVTTLGQPLVGIVSASGGVIALGQGFWHGGAAEYCIYLPLILRHYDPAASRPLPALERTFLTGHPLGRRHRDPLGYAMVGILTS